MAALFMVFLFLLFLVTDIVVRRLQTATEVSASLATQASGSVIPISIGVEDLNLPEGVFFHPGHTWAHLGVSGQMKVGLDDFSQKILGRIDAIKSKKIGDRVRQGDSIVTIKQGKRQAEFRSPVDGVIDSVNEELLSKPESMRKNPYEAGWIYSIKPTNITENIKSLRIADDAASWIKNEISRFKNFLSEEIIEDKYLGKTMADGGIPVTGVMEHMDDMSWMKMQEHFFKR
jgi:glycine cleavage system H lipoate-binding protein